MLLELGSIHDANDPTAPTGDRCPQVSEFLTNFEQVETLTREMAQLAATCSKTTLEDQVAEEVGIDLESLSPATTVSQVISDGGPRAS